jgi:hypothetical protein
VDGAVDPDAGVAVEGGVPLADGGEEAVEAGPGGVEGRY